MDKDMKSIDRMWENSLSFMDNIYAKVIIYVILILLASGYFENINMAIANLHKNHKWMNVIVLLIIVYVSRKCPIVGILLAIVYIMSVHCYTNKETFLPGFDRNTEDEMNKETFIPILSKESSEDEKKPEMKHFSNEGKECKSLYTPHFEAVGDVCDSVHTFKNELNAQGLNSPEGFDGDVMGAPL